MGLRELTIYRARTEAARDLRKRQTIAESKLWQKLRKRQIQGFKFRRQFPIGSYFADFCCMDKKLVIEVDGGIHMNTKNEDENRSHYIRELGFRVLRFSNAEILADIDAVCDQIVVTLSHRERVGQSPG